MEQIEKKSFDLSELQVLKIENFKLRQQVLDYKHTELNTVSNNLKEEINNYIEEITGTVDFTKYKVLLEDKKIILEPHK
jgi:hypothetical protein